VHPSGYEVWLTGSATGASGPAISARSAPQVAPRAPTDPNVQEAHEWAENFDARFNELQDEFAKLKVLENPKGTFPAGPFNAYCEKLSRFERDLDSVLKDEVP
jgi:hypothetical protein